MLGSSPHAPIADIQSIMLLNPPAPFPHLCFAVFFLFSFLVEILSMCKAEQPLQGMELQEKETEKIKAYRKSF